MLEVGGVVVVTSNIGCHCCHVDGGGGEVVVVVRWWWWWLHGGGCVINMAGSGVR